MKKEITLLLALFMVTGTVLAQTSANEELKEGFNNNIEDVPSPIISLIEGEVININLDTDIDEFSVPENTSKVGVSMEDSRINNITTGGYENKTLQINITAKNIDQIKNVTDPIQKTSSMVQNGDIEYETYRLTTTIKTTIIETGLKVFSLF